MPHARRDVRVLTLKMLFPQEWSVVAPDPVNAAKHQSAIFVAPVSAPGKNVDQIACVEWIAGVFLLKNKAPHPRNTWVIW